MRQCIVSFCLLSFFLLASSAFASSQKLLAQAQMAYYQDDFEKALGLVEQALKADPPTAEPYLVASTILAHRRDFKGLQDMVKTVRKKWPGAVEGYLIEADLLFLQGKGAAARRLLDKAAVSHEEDMTVQLNRIILLAATGEATKARKLLERSLGKKKLVTAEEILNVCAALVVLPGGSERALGLLRKCRQLYGESSQVLLLEGMVFMREASWGRAVSALLKGLERNLEKLSEMMMLAPLLAGLGHAKAVEEILSKARKVFPQSKELRRLLVQVKARAADEKRLIKHEFDGLVLHVPPTVDKELLKSVNKQIKRALAKTEKFFGVQAGAVRIKLMSSTGVASAAYYDAPNDTVFIGNRLIQDYPAGAALLEELLTHEFGHLLTNRILRKAGIGLDGPAVPSWFAEGLAECAAGNVKASQRHFPKIYLSKEELLLGISLSSIGRPACRQAYAQACIMVDELLSRRGKRSVGQAIVEFSQEYRKSGDLNQSLEKVFAISAIDLRLELVKKSRSWGLSKPAKAAVK